MIRNYIRNSFKDFQLQKQRTMNHHIEMLWMSETFRSATIDLRTVPEHDTLKINNEDVTGQPCYELTVNDISQEATISLQVDDKNYEIKNAA